MFRANMYLFHSHIFKRMYTNAFFSIFLGSPSGVEYTAPDEGSEYVEGEKKLPRADECVNLDSQGDAGQSVSPRNRISSVPTCELSLHQGELFTC